MNEKTVISIAQNAISMDTYYQKLRYLFFGELALFFQIIQIVLDKIYTLL